MNTHRSQRSSIVRGLFWMLSACLISAVNDAIFKYLGQRLHGVTALFFRFFFSVVTLLPFVMHNAEAFKTRFFWTHGLRGGLFVLGMLPWVFGLISLPTPLMTVLSFTTPLFVTILASTFLKERVNMQRWVVTCIGFGGIVLSAGNCWQEGTVSYIILALGATFIFALLDVLNKHLLITKEGVEPMMLFSTLWTLMLTLPLAIIYWEMPTMPELFCLLLLGLGANGLLGCLLKASQACDLSAIQPFRYTEFIFSSILSILIFQQWPSPWVYIGMVLIVPTAIYLTREEFHQEKNTQKTAPDVTLAKAA